MTVNFVLGAHKYLSLPKIIHAFHTVQLTESGKSIKLFGCRISVTYMRNASQIDARKQIRTNKILKGMPTAAGNNH